MTVPKRALKKSDRTRTQTGFRLDDADLERLDAIAEHLSKATPGVKFTRTDAIRVAIRSYKVK